jgi:hypothetical protein
MMQNNARLFSDDLIRDYKKLYTRILKCCEHQNRPLSQIAYGALESLLKEAGGFYFADEN